MAPSLSFPSAIDRSINNHMTLSLQRSEVLRLSRMPGNVDNGSRKDPYNTRRAKLLGSRCQDLDYPLVLEQIKFF